MIWWVTVIWFIIVIPIHEWGHAWVAKKQGIFEKYTITILGPAVKMRRPFKKAHDYMSGIYASILTLPVWLLAGGSIIGFLIAIFVLGSLDIIVMMNWSQVKEEIAQYEELQEYKRRYGEL